MTQSPEITPAWEARCLLRAARAGTMATQAGGQPYAALVTPAVAPDGSVLMLLSGLSEHTRHLQVDPRCSVLVAGPAPEANPQTAPRLTILGVAAPEPHGAMRARWLAIHPYAGFYADLPDFTLWRVQPARGHFVGGFARAYRLSREQLVPEARAVAALEQAEASVIEHCNDDHAGAMDAIAQALHPGAGTGWRMVAVDTDGCDLGRGETVVRVAWSGPADDAMQMRGELVRLAHAARNPALNRLDPAGSVP